MIFKMLDGLGAKTQASGARNREEASERFETLAHSERLRIERIISQNHASAEGFWYDQAHGEWVLLLSGTATLRIQHAEGGQESVELVAGSCCHLPAHCRHRVDRTSANTVWLAVHYGA